jgi:radical SAM protein with 4Fe4S-binding SPASM domain
MPTLDSLFSSIKSIKHAFSPLSAHPPPGVHPFEYHGEGERSRIHLRVEPEGSGILIVNANRIMHLNRTAVFMAYLYLNKTPEETAIRAIRRAYRISQTQATLDYTHLCDQVFQLIRPDGACPLCDLDIDITLPFSARPSAPYRMDLALTYRCNNDCAHCYNARPRDFKEMDTSHWFNVLDRLWAAGIPHVVFTGGEPTLRDDLPALVAHAEKNGQITGLNTNARRLRDPRFLARLVEAGLDHIQVTVESHDPTIHDRMVASNGAWKQTIEGLKMALDTPLYVMTNTTLLKENSLFLAQTLDFLGEVGVPTIGLNALIYSGRGAKVGSGLSEEALPPLLDLARDRTSAYGQRLIWYTPTQYCNFDPMQLELGVKGCTAALYNMCVEPDGGVIPCQSYYRPVGNILTDPWEKIWNHDISISLRERRYIPDKCHACTLLSECGGGCPLYIAKDDPSQP